MSTFLIGFGTAFLFGGGAFALGGLLYNIFAGLGAALRRRRYRDCDQPATKQDIAKVRDAWQGLLDDIRRERMRIERGDQ